MNVEQMIGWVRATDMDRGVWVTQHGEYRKQAEVDDMLYWLQHEEGLWFKELVRVGGGYSARLEDSVTILLGNGRTIKDCFVNSVQSRFYTKRVKL